MKKLLALVFGLTLSLLASSQVQPVNPVVYGVLQVGANGPSSNTLPIPSCTNNCDVLIGWGAGVNLNPADHFTVAIGFNALNALTGNNSEATAIGWNSQGNVTANLNGNTSIGINTIAQCTSGCTSDTVIGQDSMRNVGATGAVTNAVGVGNGALFGAASWVGADLIGIGSLALHGTSATTASQDIAIGTTALTAITTGSSNVVIGHYSGVNATTDVGNVYIGESAGGGVGLNNNVCIGNACMGFSTQVAGSDNNVGLGYETGYKLTTGGGNTFLGYNSGHTVTTGNNNICIGVQSCAVTLTTTGGNIVIGQSADTLTTSTVKEVNIGGLLFYNINSVAAPAVTACGTSPSIDARANNRSGTVTVGSGAIATCTITFAGSGYLTWNHCRVTSQLSEAAFAYSYTKTVLTVTATSLTSDLIDYDCDGY